jgi:hypothetical protein
MVKRIIRHTLIVLLVLIFGNVTGAQTTAFTYQGNLTLGGAPASGNYDFQFVLFSVATGGTPLGLGLGINNVPVTNGSFSAILNFQNQFTGSNRFLEIRVRPAGQGTHTTLTPRQPILSAPYSINAAQLGGTPADQFVVTTDSRLFDSRDPLPNSDNYIQNRATQQAVSNFNISGNGTIGGALSVQEASTFQKSVTVGTTLNIGETSAIGGNLTVGGTLTVNSPANVTGAINTGSQFRVGGNFALGRSRLDLFNTDVTPRGFTFEVLNNPEFLVVKNELGATLMTVANDGKVGIGDNSPTEATLEVGGTVQISGSLSVGQLGGGSGDHLCRGAMGQIQTCAAATIKSDHEEDKVLAELRSVIRQQQTEIERQRKEFAALKSFICAQNSGAEICRQ